MTNTTDDRPLLERIVRPLPPRGYRVDDYKRWFPRTGDTMRRSLRQFAPLTGVAPADGPAVAVVVSPWFGSPVPWFAIMLGIGLARRGRRVVLCLDDTPVPQEDLTDQLRTIERVLGAVDLPVVRVGSRSPSPARAGDAELVASLADQNVTWAVRGAPQGDERLAAAFRSALGEALGRIRATLTEIAPDLVVVPGGVCNTSGLFLAAAGEQGARGATFDVDRGIVQVCVSGVAAQGGDLARAFTSVWDEGPEGRAPDVAIGREEYSLRTRNVDRYGFQVVAANTAANTAADTTPRVGEIAAVIPMNVEWDAAALGRHRFFRNSADWIGETVATVLAEDAGTVVVRQHPSERRAGQRSRLDVGALLRDRFGDDPRVRFVAADDPTSSYDLLAAARLVLPYVSTIAIEAAALGTPVLIAGSCYFDDLGFVHTASTREEYLQLVRLGVGGRLPVLPDQQERAWVCYSLAAVHNRVYTDFTPGQEDFWSWCRQAPDALFTRPEVADVFEALGHDVPVSVLRRRRGRSAPAGAQA